LSWMQRSEFYGAPGYGLDGVEGGSRLLVDITEGFEVARLRGLLRVVDGVGVGPGEDETEKKDRDCAQCPETQNQRRKKRSNVAKIEIRKPRERSGRQEGRVLAWRGCLRRSRQ
jgi:hypothetical protein